MDKSGDLLVLLSESLYDILNTIKNKHKCKVAEDLIEAHDLIKGYNFIVNNLFTVAFDSSVYDKTFYHTKQCLLNRINELLTDEARMLSVRFNEFEISFLPKGKQPVYSSTGIWSRENRQTAKPARIVQKVLAQKYSCKEFEDFSNWLKAELVNSGDFQIVVGPDITRYYDVETYLKEEGTLGNSCMRYSGCAPFFEIYEDHAKMLICLRQGKLIGRAIVWEVNGKTFLDRIYTCFDYLENQFIDYAREHKWYHRMSNDLLENRNVQGWLGPEDNYKTPHQFDLTIKLGKNYSEFPYVDSFRYFDPDNLTINTIWKPGMYYLDSTDGTYYDEDDCDDYEEYRCAECGYVERVESYGDLEEIVWSELDEEYFCTHCATYCDGIDDWVGPSHKVVDVHVNKNCDKQYPEEYLIEHAEVFVEINDEWYDKENHILVYYDESTDEYKLKDE